MEDNLKMKSNRHLRLWVVLGMLFAVAVVGVLVAVQASLHGKMALSVVQASVERMTQDDRQPKQGAPSTSLRMDKPTIPKLNLSATSSSGSTGNFFGKRTQMELATKQVLDSQDFIKFSTLANLSKEKQSVVAKLIALARINTETARRSGDATVRTLSPDRLRKDAYVQIIAQLSKEEREAFEGSVIMEEWLPQAASP